MRRTLFFALAAAALAWPAVRAQVPVPALQGPSVALTPAGDSDVQDLVYLGDRPLLLRLHLRVEGKPYHAPWKDAVQKLFDYLDRNDDNALSKEEAERAPGGSFLQTHFQGAIGGFGRDSNAKMAELDNAPKDDKVSSAELEAYYKRFGITTLKLEIAGNRGLSDVVTDALFRNLDRDADGKLSKEELAAAPVSLNRLDQDEDEIITQDELAPQRFVNQGIFFGGGFGAGEGSFAGTGFLDVTPGQPPTRQADAIMKHYDADKDGSLSAKEIGFDKEDFDALDANKNGALDAGEVAGFFGRPSDLELMLQAGKKASAPAKPGGILGGLVSAARGTTTETPVDLFNPTKRTMPLEKAVRKPGDGSLVLASSGAEIEVRPSEAGATRAGGLKQFYLQQFRQADADKKGVLEKKQVEGSQFLGLFAVCADADGDGKLAEKELSDFLDMTDEMARATASLMLTAQGRGLFELLDGNRDSRLSVRESRSAWDRVGKYNKAGDGRLATDDVPRQFQLVLSQGQNFGRGRVAVAVRVGGPGVPPSQSGKGPVWFRKMDRNGDGDVSPREFLGGDEEFRRFDADGDGLISLEEVEKAEAANKPKATKEDP